MIIKLTQEKKEITVSKNKSSKSGKEQSVPAIFTEETKEVSLQKTDHIDTLNTLKEKKEPSSFSLEWESEFRIFKNSLSRNQKSLQAEVPYTELSLHYSSSPALNFFATVEFSSYKKEWGINPEELKISFSPKSLPFRFQGGWLPLPLGYNEKPSRVFLQIPTLYKSLTRNREDAGITTEVKNMGKRTILSAQLLWRLCPKRI